MGIKILGSRFINCDGIVGSAKCKASFSTSGTQESLEEFIKSALDRGWVYNSKSDQYICSKCAEIKQQVKI